MDKRWAYCSTLALSPGLPAAAAPLPTVVQRPVRIETPNLGYCRVKLTLTNLAQCCWWRSRARPSAARRGRPCSCWRTSRPASRSWRPCRPRPSACGHARRLRGCGCTPAAATQAGRCRRAVRPRPATLLRACTALPWHSSPRTLMVFALRVGDVWLLRGASPLAGPPRMPPLPGRLVNL